MDQLFADIGRVTDLLPVLLFIFFALKSKKHISNGLWVIFFYCICVALNDLVIFPYVPEQHLNIVMSSFTLIEYFAVTYFLWVNTDNKKFQKILAGLFVLFSSFIVVYFLMVPFDIVDSVPVGVETILVISLSVYILYEQVNNSFDPVYNKPVFWVITALLIYLAGSFFIYLYANYVPYKELQKIWFVTFIFTSIKSIFLTIAFWLEFKKPNDNNHSKPYEYQPFLN